MAAPALDADVFLIEQLIRPMVNLYKISAGGQPVAFVRQKRMAIKEDIRFFADESETEELFRLKARSMFELAGAYDVAAGDERIGAVQKVFGASLLRSTWRILGSDGAELATAYEKSLPVAVLRRAIDFVPYVGGLIPIPFHFTIGTPEESIGELRREYAVRDRYTLDLSRDTTRVIDRRLAIALAVALDALQSR
jgi:uncharacterized protein YxjI